MRDERGQIAIPLFFVMVVLMTAGFWFFQVGRASLLQARVTTAADAGALAGGEELKRQYIEYLETYALSGAPFIPNVPLIRARAADYTARNDGTVTNFSVDLIRLRVTVEVANTQSMDGAFGMSDPGDRGSFEATAQVTIVWSFPAPAFGGSGGGPVAGGGGGPLGDVAGLHPGMAEAVRQLNEAMGGGLHVVSGYRSYQEQIDTCAIVTGPCAPPGRSMHQYGMAIDIPGSQVAAASAALAAHPEIAICWLNIPGDSGHFSYQESKECGGTQGTGGGAGLMGSGGVFGGGGIGSLGTFDVHLVDDDYAIGGVGLSTLPDLNGNGGLGDPTDPRSWQALIECESSGNPRAIEPAPDPHFGLFQFSIPTWQSVGGTGNPIDATPEEQFRRARMLYARSGWHQWECAQDMGWPNRWPGS